MDDISRSSFIPKQSAGMIPSAVRKRKRFHVFGFIGSVCLIGSVLLSVGVFFYKSHVGTVLDDTKNRLDELKDQFSEDNVLAVRTFERRLDAAEYLLDNHIAPSKIFDALEISTLVPVQFTSFTFEQRPSQDVTLTIQGATEEFKTVALQSLKFNEGSLLAGALFTELGTSDGTLKGQIPNSDAQFNSNQRVGFKVVGNINQSLLAYDGEDDLPQMLESAPGATANPSDFRGEVSVPALPSGNSSTQ